MLRPISSQICALVLLLQFWGSNVVNKHNCAAEAAAGAVLRSQAMSTGMAAVAAPASAPNAGAILASMKHYAVSREASRVLNEEGRAYIACLTDDDAISTYTQALWAAEAAQAGASPEAVSCVMAAAAAPELITDAGAILAAVKKLAKSTEAEMVLTAEARAYVASLADEAGARAVMAACRHALQPSVAQAAKVCAVLAAVGLAEESAAEAAPAPAAQAAPAGGAQAAQASVAQATQAGAAQAAHAAVGGAAHGAMGDARQHDCRRSRQRRARRFKLRLARYYVNGNKGAGRPK